MDSLERFEPLPCGYFQGGGDCLHIKGPIDRLSNDARDAFPISFNAHSPEDRVLDRCYAEVQ